jgi:hypothetical protein
MRTRPPAIDVEPADESSVTTSEGDQIKGKVCPYAGEPQRDALHTFTQSAQRLTPAQTKLRLFLEQL